MLLRLLMIAAAIWILIYLFRARRASQSNETHNPIKIVRCAHCGVHLPINDAVGGPNYFCSAEHQRLGRKDNS